MKYLPVLAVAGTFMLSESVLAQGATKSTPALTAPKSAATSSPATKSAATQKMKEAATSHESKGAASQLATKQQRESALMSTRNVSQQLAVMGNAMGQMTPAASKLMEDAKRETHYAAKQAEAGHTRQEMDDAVARMQSTVKELQAMVKLMHEKQASQPAPVRRTP